MKTQILVLPLWTKLDEYRDRDTTVISTVSHANNWQRNLSPFALGPCKLYDKFISLNMENAWQFSKVYAEHSSNGNPDGRYWDWATKGWASIKAQRYPMGKGKKPLYAWWDGDRLDYIEARKTIYGPLYIEAVHKTVAYKTVKDICKDYKRIILLDYDAYDHRKLGMNLTDVLNETERKMGHAFVLMMLLTKDKALKQMKLRPL